MKSSAGGTVLTRRTHAGKRPVFATGSSRASDSQSAAKDARSDREGLR